MQKSRQLMLAALVVLRLGAGRSPGAPAGRAPAAPSAAGVHGEAVNRGLRPQGRESFLGAGFFRSKLLRGGLNYAKISAERRAENGGQGNHDGNKRKQRDNGR